MEHHETLPFVAEALVVLAAAGLLVPLFQRLGLGTILGYLLAGLVIGPYGIGRLAETVPWLSHVVITDPESVRALAELGVVFLLFRIGLEISLSRLWSLRLLVFGVGGTQVVLTAAVLSALLHLFGLSGPVAITLGACLALSSTAIVVELLVERRRFASPVGRSAFSVLLFQDLAVVPILFLISALGGHGEEGGSLAISLLTSLGLAAFAIVAILLVGRVVIQPTFRFVGARQNRDAFTAATLFAVIGIALLTATFGLSMALGAFLAGLLFSDTEFKHQIEADIDPFKGLFLGLFFLSVGMTIDPLIVLGDPLLLVAALVGIMVVKATLIVAIALAFRLPVPIAVETGILLSQVGEFALVGLGLARVLGVIEADLFQFLIVAAGASMGLTPVLATLAERVGRRLERHRSLKPLGAELTSELGYQNHVIIAGYGRTGRMVAALLEAQSADYVAVDLDSRIVARFRKEGDPVYFGDIRRADVLASAGVERAAAIVLTMDEPTANETALEAIRRYGHRCPVIARARDPDHARKLFQAGVSEVVLETLEASLQMGEAVLRAIGQPQDLARDVIDQRREREFADLETKMTRPGKVTP